MNILFLYTELAEYTLACLKALKNSKSDINILVIHFPVNPEAPFKFDFEDIGNFRCLSDFSSPSQVISFIDLFAPDKIIVSGWKVPYYIQVCKKYRKTAVVVLTMDNHYTGSLKQKVFRVLSPILLLRTFKYCWVPGAPQKEYALKLGFNKSKVKEGFYCCNLEKFDALYKKFLPNKQRNFPKVFLCVARYIPQKNYELLWNAFIKWQNDSPNEWQLWCAGTGENFNKRVNHPSIRHLGFIQGNEWENVIAESGVFVLPSLFEPWGVVVHEFSASGFPLLLSERVGASTKFLNVSNGILFNPSSEEEIIKGFEFMRNSTYNNLTEMMTSSNKNAYNITPSGWASTITEEFL